MGAYAYIIGLLLIGVALEFLASSAWGCLAVGIGLCLLGMFLSVKDFK